jgi:hypothetical protein
MCTLSHYGLFKKEEKIYVQLRGRPNPWHLRGVPVEIKDSRKRRAVKYILPESNDPI